ncbi:SpoIIE family protein phosphatase [Streptomyces sp. NPDC093984]|uniref:SpoIIE family protein phosphatase n=1 Tax=Streptomyces sp. NPDC093984 TaxID=3366052 RepID=UPI003828B93A
MTIARTPSSATRTATDGCCRRCRPGTEDAAQALEGLGDRFDVLVHRVHGPVQHSVVLFTDGLYEGRTARGRLGVEGLLSVAARHTHLESQKCVDAPVRGASLLAAPFGGLVDDVAVLHLACDRRGQA